MKLTVIKLENGNELRRLTADKGMVLTNGGAYSKEIYLGSNDDPENWSEITDAEYDEKTKAEAEKIEEF